MPVVDSVHLHGQIRDAEGGPRQAQVVISTYLGPDITQTISTADGYYAFDLPAVDHYVVTVYPYLRASVGNAQVPVGFLDGWERVNRTTETHLDLDVIVKPGGTILLDAYDPPGRRVFADSFPDMAYFAVYPLGTPPVIASLQLQNHQRPLVCGWETVSGTERNPAVLMLPSEVTTAFTVWGLWTVPEAGTIMLEMDNGGVGFSVAASEVMSINIAYELARTEYRKAQQKYDGKIGAGYVFSSTIASWLTQAAGRRAYRPNTPAIRVKEEIVLEAARQDIEARRAPVTINVVDADAQPLSGVHVAYQQINHDFILAGNWGGDGVPLGDTPATRQLVGNTNIYADIAKEIGFEYLNYPPYPGWAAVQRDLPAVPYRFDDDVILRQTADRGFRATGNAVWMAGSPYYAYPPFLHDLTYTETRAAALDFVTTTVSHYAGKIAWFNLMMEPNTANALDFTGAQMLDFTQAVLTAGRAADPQGAMSVLLSAPGLGYITEPAGKESAGNFSTYDYLQEMLKAGVRPDSIGIQFYYGSYLPAIDLGTVSDLLDVYGSDFDLPFYIEELEYPTLEEYPGLDGISARWGWRQGHTDQAQADWAVGIYTLAFSKPHILGANWSMAADLPADIGEDGRQGDGYLHRDGLTPRPMAYALRDLFHSWTISGAGQTGGDGHAGFDGFSGEYWVTLTAPNGAVRQETIHVSEGLTNTFILVFDQDQTLADNQQAGAASLSKARSALSWAGALGKTSGVDEVPALPSPGGVRHRPVLERIPVGQTGRRCAGIQDRRRTGRLGRRQPPVFRDRRAGPGGWPRAAPLLRGAGRLGHGHAVRV
jgi:hypothetical protein